MRKKVRALAAADRAGGVDMFSASTGCAVNPSRNDNSRVRDSATVHGTLSFEGCLADQRRFLYIMLRVLTGQ
jgi:hypothetical protein